MSRQWYTVVLACITAAVAAASITSELTGECPPSGCGDHVDNDVSLLQTSINMKEATQHSFEKHGHGSEGCPFECIAPLCKAGKSKDGGLPLKGGMCHHFCSKLDNGVTSCGEGPEYEDGNHHDCQGCHELHKNITKHLAKVRNKTAEEVKKHTAIKKKIAKHMEKCPFECISPHCKAGNPSEGGEELIKGMCHSFCSKLDKDETRICGSGPDYEDDQDAIDCEGCMILHNAIHGPVKKGNATATAAGDTTTTIIDLKTASAAEATGVGENGAGDLSVALTAFFTNAFMVVGSVGVFLAFRWYKPEVFENRIRTRTCGPTDFELEKGYFDWMTRALAMDVDALQDGSGLDQAMLMEYTKLCMKIMMIIGVPMIFIMGTMNCLFGGYAAGDDYLSYLSFGNVENGSWLYYIHCFVVWAVVFTVQVNVYDAMEKFMKQRMRWLRELPENQANTILIEDIPAEYCSDSVLKKYFEDIFGSHKVKSAYCVKNIPELQASCARRDAAQLELDAAKYKVSNGEEPAKPISAIEAEIAKAEEEIKSEKRKTLAVANEIGGVNCTNGFVTFYDRSDAEMAATAQYGADVTEFIVMSPPPPECLIWSSLQAHHSEKGARTLIGYLLVAALFALYLPLVIWIGELAEAINMGPLQSLWEAYAPTLGLMFMVAMLPTFLQLIFSLCFNVTNISDSQQMIQNWYFFFQVVFVLLVTAIGGSLWSFLDALCERPFEMFEILGKTMPNATHFYMNFLMLAWAAHGMNLTRYIQLGKYVGFCKLFPEDQALEMSEPEDQDYYGIGSRSARFSIMMGVGIIFGTLSPPMNLLCWINFYLCRVIYGYLIPFAETRKPDRGGEFFVFQLKHIFVVNMIYCVVMTGVLLGRASTSTPGVIAAPSLLYVIWSQARFSSKFAWERLPMHEVSTLKRTSLKPATGDYIQPELR